MINWLKGILGINALVDEINGIHPVNTGFLTAFGYDGIRDNIKELNFKIELMNTRLYDLEKHFKIKRITEKEKTYYRSVGKKQ